MTHVDASTWETMSCMRIRSTASSVAVCLHSTLGVGTYAAGPCPNHGAGLHDGGTRTTVSSNRAPRTRPLGLTSAQPP